MKLLFDTNVLVDVLAERAPFFAHALDLVNEVFDGHHEGVVAVHSVTTVYYLIEKPHGPDRAIKSVDWLLSHFTIAPATKKTLLRAREIHLPDFEDAVIVASAEQEACDAIITRDRIDFSLSPIPSFDPISFLDTYGAQN